MKLFTKGGARATNPPPLDPPRSFLSVWKITQRDRSPLDPRPLYSLLLYQQPEVLTAMCQIRVNHVKHEKFPLRRKIDLISLRNTSKII